MNYRLHLTVAVLLFVLDATKPVANSADPAPAETLSLANGKLTLTAPASWVKKEPKFRGIALYEFSAPKAETDATDGRMTVGQANGGVEANQQRWLGQFVQADGARSDEKAQRTEKDVAGCKVYRLDVSGTYLVPQFSGGGKFPDYRQLAAIIVSPQHGSWYVRLYGPQKTVGQHAADFDKMIDGLKAP